MKTLGLLVMCLLSCNSAGAKSPSKPASASVPKSAPMSDIAGGRFIPKGIIAVLADPRLDPSVAFIFWQLARRPLDEWKVSELNFVMQVAPTLAETGISVIALQTLYEFFGLDPDNLFNPQPAQTWQNRSVSLDPRSAAEVAAISSADCQANIEQMTVATLHACAAGAQ